MKSLGPILLIFLLFTPARFGIASDVIVYGSTPAGICAAVAAARDGRSVTLAQPGRYLGGMMSSGLGNSDVSTSTVIGGLAREVFIRIGETYPTDNNWRFEPHVAEQVFGKMLSEQGITLAPQFFVDTVEKEGTRILAMTSTEGLRIEGKVFIDASYEGDLMARAGVAYTYGRESVDTYGEAYAGVRNRNHEAQWPVSISARDEQGRLRHGVEKRPLPPPGQGDDNIPAYNFRLCLTDEPANQLPISAPAGYLPEHYELLQLLLAELPGTAFTDLFWVFELPNHKWDLNNRGPFSSNLLGGSRNYPEADYAERALIWDQHKQYLQGLLYFLQQDPSVPAALRTEAGRFGLARDEFPDNENWPHQLYIREARRMQGAHVLTQADVLETKTKPDSIGMGAHRIESHHVQRIEAPDGIVYNKGDVQVRVAMEPYQIPYRSITPLPADCANLLVPVCVSASHVAYSSIRMEPQYMIMGHAAGVAAAQALTQDTPVQDIDLPVLQQKLREQGQVLSL